MAKEGIAQLGTAIVGGIIGGPIGFIAGAMLGAYLFPVKNEQSDMPPMASYPVQRANKGVPKPIVYGTDRLAGNIIWMGDLDTITERHGGGGGKGGGGEAEYTTTRYQRSFLISICEGTRTIIRCWQGKNEVDLSLFTRYTGEDNVGIAALTGETLASDYKKDCCAFFSNWDLGTQQSIPNFVFEVGEIPIYGMTYISENAAIWGIPVADGVITSLDVGGVARNVGGGIVGLPWVGHPFAAGEVVRIRNSTNFNGIFTLQVGTTADELQITDIYVAETFDGTEIIVKYIAVSSGGGDMVQDSSGNLYYGHTKITDGIQYFYITKIETDGTQTPDYVWLTHTPWSSSAAITQGLAISPDDLFLYLFIDVSGGTDYGYMYKFNLVTGTLIWNTTAVYGETSWPGYDMSIDSSGNAYAPTQNGEIRKFAASDGAGSFLTGMGQGNGVGINGGLSYAVVVDDDLGIVIGGGMQYCSSIYGHPRTTSLYNLAVRTFDDSKGAQIAVGGTFVSGANTYTYTIGTGMVVVRGGYIYVVSFTPTCTLYKLQWDGTNLSVIDSAPGPTYGRGLYFDPWGNLVVVNQDWIIGQTDVLYFYDENLTYLGKIENMYSLMLRSWAAFVGGAWIQGNACLKLVGYGEPFDANPSDIIKDLLTNVRYGAGYPESSLNLTTFETVYDYCEANDILISVKITSQKPVTDWIDYINSHFRGFIYMSAGKICLGCFKPEASAFTIAQEDLVTEVGEDVQPPISVKKRFYNETANRLEIIWENRSKDYADACAVAQEEVDQRVGGITRKKMMQLTGIKREVLANKMRWYFLFDSMYRYSVYSFALSYSNMLIEVGDVGTLSDGHLIVNKAIRVLSIEEDKDGRGLSVTAIEDVASLYAAVTGITLQETLRDSDVPAVLSVNSSVVFREDLVYPLLHLSIVPGNENVNGWYIYRSIDGGVSYDLMGKSSIDGVTSGSANSTGTLQNNLIAYPAVAYRPLDTIVVDIGTLTDLDTSITDEEFFNRKKYLKIGDEIIGYKTCVESAVEGIWTITGLIRGMFNTEAVAHVPEETVSTLDIDFSYIMSDSESGSTMYFKAVPFYGNQALSITDTAAYSHTFEVAYRKTLPVSLMRINGWEGLSTYKTDDVTIDWYFCSKVTGFGRGGYGNALWGSYTKDPLLERLKVELEEEDGTPITDSNYELDAYGEPAQLEILEADRDGKNPIVVKLSSMSNLLGDSRQITIEKI